MKGIFCLPWGEGEVGSRRSENSTGGCLQSGVTGAKFSGVTRMMTLNHSNYDENQTRKHNRRKCGSSSFCGELFH